MARSFNGSTDYIRFLGSVVFTAPFSLSLWLNLTSLPSGYAGIFQPGRGGGGGAQVIQFYVKSTGALAVYTTGAINGSDPIPSSTLTTGTWYNIVLAFLTGTNNGSLYLNGALATAAVTASSATGTSGDATAGNDSIVGGRFLNGVLADIAVWSGVTLTAGEALALGTGARPKDIRGGPNTLWWPFDGLQSPEPDLSANRFNGTLLGTPSLAAGPPFTQITPRWPQFLAPPPPSATLWAQSVM